MLLAPYKWIRETLAANATINSGINGRFWRDALPPTVDGSTAADVYPHCIISLNAGSSDNSAKGLSIADTFWLVKFVGVQADSATEMRQWVAEAYDDLHDQRPGTVDDEYLLRVQHQNPIEYVERDGQVMYLHTGGIYRVQSNK